MLGNKTLKLKTIAFQFGLLSIILFSSILLSSCGPTGPIYQDINYYKGTDGIEIDFLPQAPPDEIYEESTFNINLRVENRGAFDVILENYGLLSISFDPFYIETSGLQSSTGVQVDRNSVVIKGIQLFGKSKYHPSGTEVFMSLPNFRTKKIQGQREQPETQMFVSLCYPYVTHFADLICVDLNLMGQNLREQVCYQHDLALTDQGGPVAITQIEVENQPAGTDSGGTPVIRPVFTVHVRNKGSGSVLSPAYNAIEFDRVCSYEDLNKEDFNTIAVRALLSNTKELECVPNPIRLFNGVGFTRCSVRDQDLILGYQNYETPLIVNLSYVYLTSISKDIDIKRLNLYGGPRDAPDQCLPSEIQQGTACISKCYYCAQNPGDGQCQPPNAKYHIDFKLGFRCQCGSKDCNDLYPEGMCVPFSGYCPGANYCCLLQCSSREILINGKCYPECSECNEDGEDEGCACGTDETGYNIVSEGSMCCPDTQTGHSDYISCDMDCNPEDYQTLS